LQKLQTFKDKYCEHDNLSAQEEKEAIIYKDEVIVLESLVKSEEAFSKFIILKLRCVAL